MSSGLDRRHALTLSLNITFWFSLILIVYSAGIYLFSYHLLDESLEEDWDFTHKKTVYAGEGEELEVRIEERFGRTKLNEAMRSYIGRHFRRTWFLTMVPLVLLALAGGFGLTYYATRPGRRVVATVEAILETGDLSRRVSLTGIRKEMRPIVVLFNRLLERNETLICGMRDTLDNVAHDLRTPMTWLRATAEAALQNPNDMEATQEAVADSMEESERLLTMLNTIMDVAEAETGAMTLSKTEFGLDDLVHEVVDIYGIVAEDKNVGIRTVLEQAPRVVADVNRLRQVLANLLDNAIKYSDEKSEVCITARRDGSSAVIEVEDQGPGIPKDEQPRIWERLYRGAGTGRRGLGLGLSFVRAIVEAHAGEVYVESEPGRGSTFTIRIPGAS